MHNAVKSFEPEAEEVVEVGYVVSGPRGFYDLETESLEEAYRFYDVQNGEEDEDLGDWAIGVSFSDGTTSFEFQPLRPAHMRAV